MLTHTTNVNSQPAFVPAVPSNPLGQGQPIASQPAYRPWEQVAPPAQALHSDSQQRVWPLRAPPSPAQMLQSHCYPKQSTQNQFHPPPQSDFSALLQPSCFSIPPQSQTLRETAPVQQAPSAAPQRIAQPPIQLPLQPSSGQLVNHTTLSALLNQAIVTLQNQKALQEAQMPRRHPAAPVQALQQPNPSAARLVVPQSQSQPPKSEAKCAPAHQSNSTSANTSDSSHRSRNHRGKNNRKRDHKRDRKQQARNSQQTHQSALSPVESESKRQRYEQASLTQVTAASGAASEDVCLLIPRMPVFE